MQILLNANQLDIEGVDAETTVLELLTVVEESLKGTQATVVEIILDEDVYAADDVDQVASAKLFDFQKVELLTATAREMVQAAFADGEAGLQHLEGMAESIASDLRLGKVKEAMDHYIEFVDGIEWLITLLKNADLAFAANMAESALESDRQGLMQRLNEQTEQIQIAQEAQDWVTLADLLEYEYPEILQDSISFIKSILAS